MPKIAEIEATPNPNAMKFILKEPLTWGISRSYDTADRARDDPLAAALFAIEHVTNVFYVDHWITVTQDGKAHWPELLRELAVPIRDAPSAHQQSAELIGSNSDEPDGVAAFDESKLSTAEREKLEAIQQLLDERVRPYLQGDGGDLYVLGFEDNVLKVHYQGACGSCPSSISGTLAGLEGLVQQIDPQIEVVAV